ncbi:MAG: hypothetical protein IJ371_03050 [Clostridia bacterium]|nr:hypothetical protein [Clostridia bacterium]
MDKNSAKHLPVKPQREIKFRGKRLIDGTWIYGGFMKTQRINKYQVGGTSRYNTIIPETLGQYVGIHDKNGREIYEGDIIKSHYGSIYIVKYFADWGSFSLKLVFLNTEGKLSRATGRQHLYKNDCTRLEILGNIWDNPDLLGGSDEECDN